MTTKRIIGLGIIIVIGALIIYAFPMVLLVLLLSVPVLFKRLLRPSYGWMVIIIIAILFGLRVIQSFA